MSMMGGGWQLMRSFRRDEAIRSKRLSPGLVRRIARFAAPYRRLLLVFLVLIVVDAAVAAANPLVYRAIIDNGILPGDSGLVIQLALLLVVLAIFDVVLVARVAFSLARGIRTQRRFIARLPATRRASLSTRWGLEAQGAGPGAPPVAAPGRCPVPGKALPGKPFSLPRARDPVASLATAPIDEVVAGNPGLSGDGT